MNTFDTVLEELKISRLNAKQARETVTAMIAAVKESPSYVEAVRQADEAEATAKHFEDDLRQMALTVYAETKDKNPHEKVQVKIFREFRILDRDTLRAWVDTNLRDALIVDTRKVEDYATKIGAVAGTEVIDVPKAQIATKL